jgi:hypothetical protein
MKNHKVLITTAGLGQRLGEMTKFTNKALVRIGKKPTISYIIESYPQDTPFVIATGYFGDHVEDFVKMAYPDRPIEFVRVDKYEGKGSSLGYTMLTASSKLQCPFIYHACDTIVTQPVPPPDKNWVGGYKGDDASVYASWKVSGDKISSFNDRGATDFDYIHIGLVGVRDYEAFWQQLNDLYRKNTDNTELNDSHAIVGMIGRGHEFSIMPFPVWHDTGNVVSFHKTKEKIADHFDNLDKVDESIFIFDNFVIKFFHNKEIVKNRIERSRHLKGLVPEITKESPNFYRYDFVKGDLYSRVVNPSDFSNFLQWAKTNLWKEKKEVENAEFKHLCRDFYEAKTKSRVKKFLTENSVRDQENIINGDRVPKLEEIFSKIDFGKIADTKQCQFHGDLILDNILRTEKGYCLLDWRQDFNGLLEVGDIYYDLAKLNHNLTVNHDIIYQNLFTIKISDNAVNCDIMRKHELVACQEILFDFIRKEGYDLHKVKLITGLIWLNMSPLHHHPFNLFLYYFGKWNLWRTIQEKK